MHEYINRLAKQLSSQQANANYANIHSIDELLSDTKVNERITHHAFKFIEDTKQSYSDLDDVKQELMLCLCKEWGRFNPTRSRIYTYVEMVLKGHRLNLTKFYRRHAGRFNMLSLFEAYNYSGILVMDTISTDTYNRAMCKGFRSEYAREEFYMCLADLRNSLSDVDKAILKAFIECDCSISATAHELKMHENTVSWHLKNHVRPLALKCGLLDCLREML